MYILFNLIVFLASFLLFQIELIVAKAVLPGFGGSYQVWSSCVMFFQGVLLLGYIYVYMFNKKFNLKRHFLIHIIIISIPLLLFPIQLSVLSSPNYNLPMVIDIIWLLTRTIGLAFFVLASTSIIIQNYLAASSLPQYANPYILYATSNLGSFCALLSYPFLVVPMFDLHVQIRLWQAGFILLYGMYLIVYFAKDRMILPETSQPAVTAESPSNASRLYWLLLSAAASAMFLAVTNTITFDLAAIPLLWIMPLGIYLLSFILTFKRKPWYPNWLRDRFPMATIIGIFLFMMMSQSYKLPIVFLLMLHMVILFIVSVTCHGELNKNKPKNVNNLSEFYIILAMGGFLGSVLVSWIIPIVSKTLIEYIIAFLLASVALSFKAERRKFTQKIILRYTALLLLVLAWPLILSVFSGSPGKIIAVIFGILFSLILYGLCEKPKELSVALVLLAIASQFVDIIKVNQSLVHRHRNFYGIYRIYDKNGKRFLHHGTTLHGSQYLEPSRQNEALTYYHVTTPAGELLSKWHSNFDNIGIVGLGAGSLATYATPDQKIDFFELDPYNKIVAEKYFTYLKKCLGKLRLIFGDARISLAKIQNNYYSVLAVDAFNSDSIPVHLITVEAITEYIRLLKTDGIVIFHISNKYLNLRPVMYANASYLNLRILYNTNLQKRHPDAQFCEWLAITADDNTADKLITDLKWIDLNDIKNLRKVRPWTDQYTNLLSTIR